MSGALTRMLGRNSGTLTGGPYTTSGQIGPFATGSNNYSASAGEFTLMQLLAAPSFGNVVGTSMDIIIGASVTNGGKIKPVIYSDSAGSPNALLFTGSETTLVTADANTTKTLPFGGSFTFVSGTVYWIGWINSATFTAKGVGGVSKFKANTYASGPPATATGMSSSITRVTIRPNVTIALGIYGFWDNEPDTFSNILANEIDLISFTTANDGFTRTLSSFWARIGGGGGTVTAGDKMKAVFYSDVSGTPTALLATSNEDTIAVAGDLQFTFPSAVTFAPNTTYWMGTLNSGGTDIAGKSTGSTKFQSNTYASGPPNPLSGAISSSVKTTGYVLIYT